MTHYFISDLHLSGRNPSTFSLLDYFLREVAQDMQALYILGDFFDAWLGDDEDAPQLLTVKARLKSVSDCGIKCYFQHGNRDFLIGNTFAQETGFTLLGEEHLLEINGEKLLLMHGDSLCTDDKEYMQFRQQVRNPVWQQQILSLPLAQRRQMAAQMREQSTSMNAIKAEDIMDVNQSAVDSVMSQHSTSLLVHGHTHRPATHNLAGGGQRVVLGDWSETTGWYYSIDNQNNKQLVEFSG